MRFKNMHNRNKFCYSPQNKKWGERARNGICLLTTIEKLAPKTCEFILTASFE